jgi:hypothetical protein
MMFDDDGFSALLQERNGEPPSEDEDLMHEAIEQYLRKWGINFIANERLSAGGRFKLGRAAPGHATE